MSQGNIFPVRSNERVAVFIDGPNLHAASKTLGIDVDYKAMRSILAEECGLVRIYYYTAILEGEEYTPIKPLVDWLDYNGFTVVTKPAKQFTDSFGRTKVKGNLDVEITIDMVESAEHADHLILFSGDGDFRRVVEAVQRRGKRVTVVSSIQTNPPMVADELRRQADQFVDLNTIASAIGRERREDRVDTDARNVLPPRYTAERTERTRGPVIVEQRSRARA